MKGTANNLVYGIGINDADYKVRPRVNGGEVSCPYYGTWKRMVQRCYSDNYHSRQPTYIGCTVSNDWLYFTSFKHWMEMQDWKGKHLDKDILVEGNKLYSKDTCAFVSSAANHLFCDTAAKRGKWPIGVTRSKRTKRFISQCKDGDGRNEYLGSFGDPDSASNAYRIFKSSVIRKVAMTQADSRVIAALLSRAEKLINGEEQ